jgi:uncharacterized membrane protein YoaT (DUF817 family)
VLTEFGIFLKKQASCSVFGGLMLFFLLATKYFSVPGLYRYDLLFILAVITQIFLIAFKMETPREVIAVIVFHICAMGLEIFKTAPSVGSWEYPETAILTIVTVPLFTGFLYSSVGSYMARAWRINKFTFIYLPNKFILLLFAILIYVNFFTNHYTQDVRWIIFALLIFVFWKTKFRVLLTNKWYTFHPLFTNALLAFFVWIGEQVGTFARVWVYPNQSIEWNPVSFQKFTSWYILLIFSFILIVIINKEAYLSPYKENVVHK